MIAPRTPFIIGQKVLFKGTPKTLQEPTSLENSPGDLVLSGKDVYQIEQDDFFTLIPSLAVNNQLSTL